MSRTKYKNQTKHGMNRIIERCGIPKSCAKGFIHAASIHGYNSGHLNEGKLKDYLISKELGKGKRVKVYKGFIFIFNNTSNRLITAYPIPDDLVEEFNCFMKGRRYLN